MSNSRYETLGRILRGTRELLGWSRGQVAKKTDIPYSSMRRYELAGERDGTYPTAQQLAKLCSVLNISAARALKASLNQDDQKHADWIAFEAEIYNHPEWIELQRQYFEAARALRIYSNVINSLLAPLLPSPNTNDEDEIDVAWAKQITRQARWIAKEIAQHRNALSHLEVDLLACGLLRPFEGHYSSSAIDGYFFDLDSMQKWTRTRHAEYRKKTNASRPAFGLPPLINELKTVPSSTQQLEETRISLEKALKKVKAELKKRPKNDIERAKNQVAMNEVIKTMPSGTPRKVMALDVKIENQSEGNETPASDFADQPGSRKKKGAKRA